MKIITNCIRPYLSTIISPTQSTFIPGRRAIDNTIIVQEAVHSFRRKKGKIGNMLFQIDLEKAFDRLEWSFIHYSLHQLNFPPYLIKLIMSYVSTSSSSMLVNGKSTQFF